MPAASAAAETSQCVVVTTHPSPVIQSDPPLRDCSLCTFRTISLDKADLCATCRKLDPWGTLCTPAVLVFSRGRAQILKSYRLGQLLGTKRIVLEGSGTLRRERKSFLGTDSCQSARSTYMVCSEAVLLNSSNKVPGFLVKREVAFCSLHIRTDV
jgi:hypothetical protein